MLSTSWTEGREQQGWCAGWAILSGYMSLPAALTCLYGFVFSDNVSAYCLHIAEDDGEVDTDFPPLDSNEPIHKFGFSTLALVEKYSSPGLTSKESLFVRMWVLPWCVTWPSSLVYQGNYVCYLEHLLTWLLAEQFGNMCIAVLCFCT